MTQFHRIACFAAIVCILIPMHAQAQVAFDDFENVVLEEFTIAADLVNVEVWTRDIRTGTPREWTIDNSLLEGDTTETAYEGWAAFNIDSWIGEQGSQVGRATTIDPALGPGTGNTILLADPDAWDDFTTGAGPNTYNSFASRTYDLTGFDPTTVEISFVYEFVTEDNQMGDVKVSFDDGATFETLIEFDSTMVDNDTFFTSGVTPQTFVPTNIPANATSMILQFGCFDSGNDWWYLVDDITVTTDDGFFDFEDFEGLELNPFVTILPPGDGTDFSADIPNWVVDNSGNLAFSKEGAFDGWTAMDVNSWIEEQGGQGRSLFNIVDPNNTIMVADGDAFYDYDCTEDGSDTPDKAVNTYVSRTYDLSAFDSTTVFIQFEYEFRVENEQLGVVEVSFDSGNTFTTLLSLDNTTVVSQDKKGNDVLAQNGDVLAGLGMFQAGVDFPAVASPSMILRFGYLCADNNWWFAFDNVLVDADAGKFIVGDLNGDGEVNLLDVSPFVDALVNGIFIAAADINGDGEVNLLDVAPFVDLLTG